MARSISFFDGFSSSTTPVIGNIVASNLVQYPDDATFESTEQGAPTTGNIYYNTTLNMIRYYASGAWHTFADLDQVQTFINKSINGLTNTITNVDGDQVIVDPITGLTATNAQAAIAEHQVEIDQNTSDIGLNTADIVDIRTTTGTADGDTNMGAYASSTITDNQSTKQNITDVVTQVDTNSADIATLQSNPVFTFKGSWDASTNTPALVNGTGTTGDAYKVSVAGSHDFGAGAITFIVGDLVFYDGSVWDKDKEAVSSVAGKTGVITLQSTDITDFTNAVDTNSSVSANTAKVSADGSIDTHSDVDVTTVAPVTNNVLKYDGTNWVPGASTGGGSGEGGINYIKNPTFEVDLADVTVTSNITKSANTTSPLVGAQSLDINVDVAATTADYFEIDMNDVDLVYLGKELQISFWYRNDGTYVDNSITMKLHDVDSGTDITILEDNQARLKFTSNEPVLFRGKAQISGTDNTYTLRGQLNTNSIINHTITFDKFKVSPDEFAPAAIVTSAIDFAASANWVSNITWSGKYRRNGKFGTFHYYGILSNTSEAVALEINLPSGLSIDTSQMPLSSPPFRLEGAFTTREAGVGEQLNCYPRYQTPTSFSIGIDTATSTYTQSGSKVSNTVPFTWGAGDYIEGYVTVPIAEWSTGNLISTGETLFSSEVVRVSKSGTTSLINLASTDIIWNTIDNDKFGSYNGSTGEYTANKSGELKVNVQVSFDGNSSGLRQLFLYKNGVLNKGMASNPPGSTDEYIQSAEATIPVVKGDVIKVQIRQTSGVTLGFGTAGVQWNYASFSLKNDLNVFGVYGETELIETLQSSAIPWTSTGGGAGTYGDVISILVPAGEYDLSFNATWRNNSGTGLGVTDIAFGLSTTSGTTFPDRVNGDNTIPTTSGGTGFEMKSHVLPLYKVVNSQPTTYILKCISGNVTANLQIFSAKISARKIK